MTQFSAARARPSARYLIKIEPGTYNLGNTALALQPYVDVEGSGPSTDLRATVNDSANGAVNGSDHAVLRSLSVTNTGGAGEVVSAIYSEGNTSFLIDRVSALAQGGYEGFGLRVISSSPRVESSVLKADGAFSFSYGLFEFGATSVVTVNSSEIAATNGRWSYGAFVLTPGAKFTAQWSVFSGGDLSVVNHATNTKLAASQLNGAHFGPLKCAHAYDGAFTELGTTC